MSLCSFCRHCTLRCGRVVCYTTTNGNSVHRTYPSIPKVSAPTYLSYIEILFNGIPPPTAAAVLHNGSYNCNLSHSCLNWMGTNSYVQIPAFSTSSMRRPMVWLLIAIGFVLMVGITLKYISMNMLSGGWWGECVWWLSG